MSKLWDYAVTVWEYLRLITVFDVIDIAILSFIVYKCIGLLRKTNASKVARALLLIGAAVWLSYQFNLNAVNFVLGKAVELGLLALVVIFQPEIRRFLEQIGSNSLARTFRGEAVGSETDRAIDEIVEACDEMSKNKVGVLIVFERITDLSNIVASGTAMEASITSELIKNIFYPKAPLHDGAVVIRKGKIVAAACMLPMSESMRLSKELGMRHRAGLGMSERSDAVVVIISEESGAISVAVQGNLRRHLSPETLGRVLRNELLLQEEGGIVRSWMPGWLARRGGDKDRET